MLRNLHIKCLLLVLFFVITSKTEAKTDILLSNDNLHSSFKVGHLIEHYEDKSNTVQIKNIKGIKFKKSTSKVPNFGISNSTYWLKISLTNKSSQTEFLLNLSQPIIDNITFYYPRSNNSNKYDSIVSGESLPFYNRKYKDPNFLFDININANQSNIYYLKISSREAIQIPLSIGSKEIILDNLKIKNLLSGVYAGIMLVMIFYNLFIYFSVKDKSYIYYVVYISFVFLTQIIIQGYPYQFFWPNSPLIAQYSFFIIPIVVGIVSLIFMNIFLQTKKYTPTLHIVSILISIPYLISFIFAVFGIFKYSLPLMEISAGIVSLFMIYTGITVLRKGYQPAKYFIAAWTAFLIGVIIYVLKDFEILPYNNFTRYTMQIGSAVETVLLSFALASKINVYKAERLKAIQDKEQQVREQNIMLEHQVKKRTKDLNQALEDLKNAQVQIVNNEKMSSLGNLTAGIAHEINNPINFVSANINPLKQDVEELLQILSKYDELNPNSNLTDELKIINELKHKYDYEYLKKELIEIINGIEDGAKRTANIVKELKNFSRIDENIFKPTDIKKSIQSTLFILKNKLNNITIIEDYANENEVEVNPGKINQVLMNILTNAIDAVNIKKEEGQITIKTIRGENIFEIEIIDNGCGMNEEILKNIFDPFYTTKDIGKGTGLGMPISQTIIKNHNGKIKISSTINQGTSIVILLPIKQLNA